MQLSRLAVGFRGKRDSAKELPHRHRAGSQPNWHRWGPSGCCGMKANSAKHAIYVQKGSWFFFLVPCEPDRPFRGPTKFDRVAGSAVLPGAEGLSSSPD